MLKVISAPQVTLISRPQFIAPPHFGWKPDNLAPAAQNIAELAGRICYMSFGDGVIDGHSTVKGRAGNKQYIKNILDKQHGSVLEHASFGFLIEGISRTCSHELVRHRAGFAYSQLSQRYVEERDVAFVLPPVISFNTPEYDMWAASCRKSLAAYRDVLTELTAAFGSNKKAREAARAVLPNSTETKMCVTANIRAWRFFLAKRGSPGADREIRRLAVALSYFLTAEAPDAFYDVEVYNIDGDPFNQAIRLRHEQV